MAMSVTLFLFIVSAPVDEKHLRLINPLLNLEKSEAHPQGSVLDPEGAPMPGALGFWLVQPCGTYSVLMMGAH